METVFSPFEVSESHIKMSSEKYALNCVGKLETEMEVKKITKSCEGVVKKTKIRGTGHGTGTLSLHIPYELYLSLYGMNGKSKFLDKVAAYGSDSVHPTFTYTGVGKDEDGVEVLIAIPNAVVSDGQKWNFENGSEEVQEIELAVEILPDDNDQGMYCIPVSEVPVSITKKKWLEEFTPSMVLKVSA